MAVVPVYGDIHGVSAANIDGIQMLQGMIRQHTVGRYLGDISMDAVEEFPLIVQGLEGRVRFRFQTLQLLPTAVV